MLTPPGGIVADADVVVVVDVDGINARQCEERKENEKTKQN